MTKYILSEIYNIEKTMTVYYEKSFTNKFDNFDKMTNFLHNQYTKTDSKG